MLNVSSLCTKSSEHQKKLITDSSAFMKCFFSQLSFLNVSSIQLEEQGWIDNRKRQMLLKSRSLTFTDHADIREKSLFSPHHNNPNW